MTDVERMFEFSYMFERPCLVIDRCLCGALGIGLEASQLITKLSARTHTVPFLGYMGLITIILLIT